MKYAILYRRMDTGHIFLLQEWMEFEFTGIPAAIERGLHDAKVRTADDGKPRELLCICPLADYRRLFKDAGSPVGGAQGRPFHVWVLQELLRAPEAQDLRKAPTTPTKAGPRREADHAPFYWDLRDKQGNLTVKADDAMDAVRAMCKGGK